MPAPTLPTRVRTTGSWRAVPILAALVIALSAVGLGGCSLPPPAPQGGSVVARTSGRSPSHTPPSSLSPASGSSVHGTSHSAATRAPAHVGKRSPAPWPGVVVSVADGDTLTVRRGSSGRGEKVKIRLLGIDAPELAHQGRPAECGADAARRALSRLTLNLTVTVETDPASVAVDRYGRTLVYVATTPPSAAPATDHTADSDLAATLLDSGYVEAWFPTGARRPSRDADYLVRETAARRDRRGSWATCERLGRPVSDQVRQRRASSAQPTR